MHPLARKSRALLEGLNSQNMVYIRSIYVQNVYIYIYVTSQGSVGLYGIHSGCNLCGFIWVYSKATNDPGIRVLRAQAGRLIG